MRPDELIAAAREATGLTDLGDDELFGGDGWRTGLAVLCDALDREANLHELGVGVVRDELLQYLANRLGIVAHHRAHPELRERDIAPPIVIIGQARTGTTMLFDLLAQDPAHRVPQTWEVDRPLPPPRTESYATDPRIAEADATFAMVDAVIPGFRAVHQLGAQLAQECVRITASHFVSVIFPTQYQVPSYLDWLLHAAQEGGLLAQSYTWHRRFLEVLQSEAPGERWLLKTPAHCWSLPELLAEYPGSLLVQTHRDPARVMASITSLLAMLRRLGTDDIDPVRLAAEFAELILDGLERTVDARATGLVPAGQVVDLQFAELMAAPLEAVGTVYATFGWDLAPGVVQAMEAFLARHEREPGGHQYDFASTGLSLDEVRARTARYTEWFAVPEEPV